jgi:hypothetical protein
MVTPSGVVESGTGEKIEQGKAQAPTPSRETGGAEQRIRAFRGEEIGLRGVGLQGRISARSG